MAMAAPWARKQGGMAGISQKRDRSPVPAGQGGDRKGPTGKAPRGYALEKLLALGAILKGRAENLRLAREGPGLLGPRPCLHHRYAVDSRATVHGIVYEVLPRPPPHLALPGLKVRR